MIWTFPIYSKDSKEKEQGIISERPIKNFDLSTISNIITKKWGLPFTVSRFAILEKNCFSSSQLCSAHTYIHIVLSLSFLVACLRKLGHTFLSGTKPSKYATNPSFLSLLTFMWNRTSLSHLDLSRRPKFFAM